MTQVAAPQPMPGIAPAQPAAAGAADAAAPDADTVDFAAVLKAQIARPAKDASAPDILAALPADSSSGEAASEDDALPVPDLATLLPTLAARPGPAPLLAEAAPPPSEPAAAPLQAVAGRPTADMAVPTAEADAAPDAAATLPPGFLQAAKAETVSIAPDPLAAAASAAQSPAADQLSPAAAPHAAALPPGFLQAAKAETVSIASDPLAAATGAAQSPAADQLSPAAAPHAAAVPAHAASRADAPAAVRVDTPVGQRGWDAEVGQKVVMMVNRLESRAELTLTPPQLGRVEVSITVHGDQTSAAFVSASPAARDALEQALPRLREILAEAGITLGQASVNAESPRRDGNDTTGQQTGNDGQDRGRLARGSPPAPWLRRSEGLIDTFA